MIHQQNREKVEFIWDEPQPQKLDSGRLTFRPVVSDSDSRVFLDAIERCVVQSLDLGDQHAVALTGAAALAQAYNSPDDVFAYERSWWHLAYNSDDALVGFTQPVVFRGSERDLAHEGTIHYMGVLPEQRGNGYGSDLLCFCTATLQKVGVWRIYADADTCNSPMISAFERVGYRRGKVRTVPLAN